MFKKLVAAIWIVFLATSCGEKDLDLKGNLQGKVYLEGYGDNQEGAKIVLERDDFRIETVADKNGYYRFVNIDEGVYTLTFSYDGYGTYQLKDYPFIGFGMNGVIEETTLHKIQNVDLKNVQLSLTGGVNGYAVIKGYVVIPPLENKYMIDVLLYFDKTQNVSGEVFTYKGIYNPSNSVWSKGDVAGDTLFIHDFIHDMPKNENWYVGIYVKNSSDYKPPTTLKKAYETLKLKVQ